MLKKISINNYVFIDELAIDFEEGYQVITGETGAGKSIILDAFAVALGERLNTSSILNQHSKCTIEVEFNVDNNTVISDLLENMHLDIFQTLTIRREHNPTNGRTRSFINDTPCTLDQIQQLAIHLVDLHRQFDHLNFFNPFFEIETLDAMARHHDLIADYKANYKTLKSLTKEKEEIKATIASNQQEQDFLAHTVKDVQQYDLHPQEVEQLELEQKKLRNAEALFLAIQNIQQGLEESELAILTSLRQINKELEPFQKIDSDINTLYERLESSYIELEDINLTAKNLKQNFQANDDRLVEIEDRLSLIYTLYKKYNVISVEALLEHINQIEAKLNSYESLENKLTQINTQLQSVTNNTQQLAEQISKARATVIKVLDTTMSQLLKKIGMPNAKWNIKHSKADTYHTLGIDEIEFLVDINDTGNYSPVMKVASGGEFSRIMLCIKHILAQYANLTSMVFDEIDVGVSGETAKNIAQLLLALGQQKTVVCITHHPIVAAMATTHYYVSKTTENHITTTKIEKLTPEKRIEVIAKMIDGDNPSSTSIRHAAELIANN